MSITVNINGSNYTIPQTSETGWGTSTAAWIQAASQHLLQKTGGSFTLSAEVDFGGSFGIKTLYLKSQTANPAATGVIRLARADEIHWRDNANAADLELGVNASDQLTFNGNPVVGAAALTASRALQSNGSGVIEAAAVTATELGYVSGVTSAIQTQLGDKAPVSTTVTLAGTQTLSGKTFSDAVSLAEISTPSTPSSGFGRIYFKNDGFLYQLNDDGSESKVGAGTGGINYITNPDAESNTTGYATYSDAAATTPVDGTGGSANITWTRSTSSPLRGTANFLLTKDAVNRQGQGVSYDFTVAAADAAKVLRISFDYKSSSAFADGDVRVYIYDVTNSQLIEPTARDLAANTVNGTYLSEFQTNSNSVAYRLILHVASTNASAYTVQADNFSVGPREIARGSVVTDWVSYTPTVAGYGAGSGTAIGAYRRVGDSVEIAVQTTKDGTPGSGLTTITFTLPSGLVADSTKSGNGLANVGLAVLENANFNVEGPVLLPTTTTLAARLDASARNISGSDLTAGVVLRFSARFPIAGWSSNANISSDFGGRVIGTRAYISSNQSITTGGAEKQITLNTASFDKTSAFASNQIVVPEAGLYNLSAQLGYEGNATGERRLTIRVNGSNIIFKRFTPNVAAEFYLSASDTVQLNAGDIVTMFTYQDSGSSLNVFAGSTITYLSLNKVQSPQTMLGSEVVALRYGNSSGQSMVDSTDTVITGWTKDYDTHGLMNASTGLITIQQAGKYRITLLAQPSLGASTTIVEMYTSLFKNGATAYYGAGKNHLTYTSTVAVGVLVTKTLDLVAGDTISPRLYQKTGSNKALVASVNSNDIELVKVN